jgi:hypothetical protein
MADEGMWTYNNFPSAKVKEKYGFEPTQEWLDHVRLSSARLAGGCSGSFVSPDGLVLTNHHCAHSCIEQLSTAKKDYVKSGFFAKTLAEEVKCPVIEVNQLTEINDVTDRIGTATKGMTGQQYNTAIKAEMAKIEKECATSDDVRCDVVTLYRGGKYNLYKYRRFQDVRLAFAPEFAIAFFGGDPDNFMFPRYDLDVTFLRVYGKDGKPAKMDHYLKWNAAGVKEGDLTFVSGHPGRTSRLMTVAELEYNRDFALPKRLMTLSELRGILTEFQNRGPEQKRVSTDTLFGIENSIKGLKGRHEALLDKAFFAQKVEAEKKLRAQVEADPAKKALYGQAWTHIAQALEQQRKIAKQLAMKEQSFSSDIFAIAKSLVRYSDESQKPNEKRLREYVESNVPALKQRLFSSAPIYDEFEITMLTWSLTRLREELGADDPFVKKVLGKESPRGLATSLMKGTKLKDVKVRQQLFEGGRKAIEASNDPMIKLALVIDQDGRDIRKKHEDEIESVIKKNSELIAKAQFEAYGTSMYPDATFTLRLSYGSVKGYEDNGRQVKPVTVMAGAYERATGQEPYALPTSWLAAQSKLNLETPMNFCSDNDIIGGNSGSPVVNKEGEVVGLVFDGNIQSLGGEYGFDPAVNRAVSVHTAALTESLSKIYGAHRIVEELTGKKPVQVNSAK